MSDRFRPKDFWRKSFRPGRAPAIDASPSKAMDVLSAGRAVLALEKRIAFDGAAAVTAARTLHPASGAEAIDHRAEAFDPLARPSLLDAARPSAPQAKSVVFIESDVPDIATLIKDVDHSASIVLLDAGQDGVEAIATYLAAHEGVRDVYIFSHGSEGSLSLGTADLDAATMGGRYAADLATIKASLGPNANILVYGCDFAAGVDGNDAAHLLASLTGAAVAASTNLTGGTAEGGDFVLEDRVGAVDAPDILKPMIASDYDGLLAAPTTVFATSGSGAYHANLEFLTFANTTLATTGIVNGATASYTTAEGDTVTLTFSNVTNPTAAATFKPAALSAYAPSRFYRGYNNTASTSDMLYGGYNGTSSFTVTFTAKDANGNAYTPSVAFADGEVTESTGESYVVTTNGGAFQTVESIGSTNYTLAGAGTQTITLSNDAAGVPLLVTAGASALNIAVQVAGGKEGFALALVEPTLTLDANNSSGSTGDNYVTTFTEKGAGVAIADTDTTAVEPGVTNAASAQVVLTNAQAGDLLSVGTLPSGITGSVDTSVAGRITVDLTGGASLASYDSAIRAISFSNTSSDPSTVDRTIDVTYNDGNQNSNTAVSTIHVTAVNDPPVEAVPGPQTTGKDTALAISGLSVSDADANGGTETTTLSVADGTVSLGSTTGLTFSTGTGANDTSETFTGTLSAIDNALATLTYRPNAGFIGSDSLSFATDDNGNTGTGGAKTTTATLGITVDNVNPTATGTIANQEFADGQAGVSIATSQAFSDSLGLALTYSATGLPSGLAIDATTGAITGTIDHDASKNAPATTGSGATLDGTYTVVETASDGQGGSTTQTFTIDATNQAPVVGTATAAQANSDGDTVAAVDAAAAFSDPNGDPLTYAASGLPSGLSISAAGVISGTVAGNAAPGTDAVTVTATDDKGAATSEMFNWVVRDVPPATSGTLASRAYADSQSGVAITTAQGFTDSNGNALSYSANGLPAGLSIDPNTGVITGQLGHDASRDAPVTAGSGATLDGTYTISVTAADGLGGAATQSFTIDATNRAPVVGTATANQHGFDGNTASLDASAAFSDPNTGDALTYAASGLPTGLAIDASTGLISGTIDKGASRDGPYAVTVTATDDKGAATAETFTWTVDDVAPVATPPLADRAVPDGSSLDITTANGFTNPNDLPLTYAATGLPSGLAIDPGTGVISGTLDHDASIMAAGGNYTVAVTVDDGQGGQATNTFHLTATNQAPVVGAVSANQASSDGESVPTVDASAAFSDPNGDPLTYTASGLPAGLAIDPVTGKITGTIAADAAPGAYAVTVLATDDKGAATPETFKWQVDDAPPTTTGGIGGVGAADGQAGLAIATSGAFADPNGLPLTYTAQGLPAGLAIDVRTGAITGTLDHDASEDAPVTTGSGATLEGTYTIGVTASDGQGGSATQTFTFDATNQAPVVGLATADQRGTAGNRATANAATAFSDPNGGDILTYAASNLPQGLTIDPATGLISGTLAPAAASGTPYLVAVTATDDKGAATTERFQWTVDPVPPSGAAPIPDLATTDGSPVSIATASHFADPDDAALTYAASGLPAGLTIDPTTGLIGGTLDHDASKAAPATTGTGATLEGTYTIDVSASDGQGGSATQTFTIDAANQAPVVTARTGDQTGATGQAIPAIDAAQAFADPNGDPLTFAAGGLPAGLAIDAVTGRITGTIAADASGTYAVTVVATDDKGAATSETFAYGVGDTPPAATGGVASETYADGTAGIAVATAGGFASPNGLPLTYTATGLPQGLTIDPTTGLVTGTLDHDASLNAPVTSGAGATLDGTYTVTVTASDGQGGAAARAFTIDATNAAPVVRATSADQHSFDGNAASLDASTAFVDPNTGDTLSYAATGLPAGLGIDPATGLISGTIAADASRAGPYAVTVTATDDKGAATSETFAWAVDDIVPVATPPLADRAADDGATVRLTTANGFTNPNDLPLTYTATGLPSGLAIDPATGLIAGTLDHDASIMAANGVYTIAVTANDGQGGSATNTFHLTATNQAPVLGTPTAGQVSTDGQTITAVDTSKAFSDPNGDPLTFAVSDLPAGLSIDPATGLVTGTIAGNLAPGSTLVTVTATDDKGASGAETFSWSIDDVPPAPSGALADRTYADGTAGVAIDTADGFTSPNGLPLTFGATGLPKGLAIDPSTGVIGGTLDHDASANAPVTTGAGATLDGTYEVVVTAGDGQGGLAAQAFTIDATNQAPIIAAQTADQRNADGDVVSLAAANAFADPNRGDTLTFAASGLPEGLSIDPATGLISGTIAPSASGITTAAVTATDEKGAAATDTFTWTVYDLPPTAGAALAPVAGADGGPVAPIDVASHFGDPGGLPLTYRASGLPAGLGIDPITGVITGILDHDASKDAPVTSGSGATLEGTYTVVVTASDGQGGVASQSFTVEATNQPPAVVAPSVDQHAVDGDAVALDAAPAFADPNGDPLRYAAANLPPGLSIDAATGRVTGTIGARASASGPYAVTITATDDKGAAAAETFAWAVDDLPPTAGAPIATTSVPDGQPVALIDAGSHFADANGLPLTYSATGLPAGLSIDPANGVISGTLDHDASKNAPVTSGSGATLDGTYTVVVAASDGQGGVASQSFTIDATNQAPLVGTRTPDQRSLDGASVALATSPAFLDPDGDPLTYAAVGLPRGLAIDPATGRITGTIDPRASVYGPFAVTVTATDDKGASASETFVWRVDDVPPSLGAPIAAVAGFDGGAVAPIDAGSHFSDPNGLPLTYAATGLPAGLSIDPVTGVVSGTLDHDASKDAPATAGSGATLTGTYEVVVTASDRQGGSASQGFAITAANRPPVTVGQIPDQAGRAGQTIAPLAPDVRDPDGDPLVFSAVGLPPGLAIDPATGTIAGTIAPGIVAPTAYKVTITATDDKGASTRETFTFAVDVTRPAVLPLESLVTADAFIPLASAVGDTLIQGASGAVDASGVQDIVGAAGAADRGPGGVAATPILDAVNQTSGDQEQSVIVRADGIVISTVNGISPLDGLQDLATPGAGIVRAGAGTNERGDRFDRTRSALGRDLGDLMMSADFLGASLVERGGDGAGPAINVETVLRGRVLTVAFDNASATACVVPVARYDVTRADGSPLPAWLHADPRGLVTGSVPGGVEAIDLRITSTLRNGVVGERTVTIRTGSGAIHARPAPASPHRAGRSLADMVAAARPVPVVRQGLARFLD